MRCFVRTLCCAQSRAPDRAFRPSIIAHVAYPSTIKSDVVASESDERPRSHTPRVAWRNPKRGKKLFRRCIRAVES